MNRKIGIASALTAFALCVSLPVGASAGEILHRNSTLLSGYGGPGAGEQAIIGSSLLSTPHGSARSGDGTSSPASNASTMGQSSASAAGESSGVRTGAGGEQVAGRAVVVRAQPTGAADPLRNDSAHSSLAGSGDFVLLAAVVLALALIATITARLARLQR